MDYNLAKVRPGEMSLSLDTAMNYGQMPHSLLVSKFEETDIGEDENVYDDYARGILVDKRPDQNKFEHEEARGGVNRSSGRLQLQYYGHRGNVDGPYHPEMFLGEAGPESRDPRGSNVDPDMKQLRAQEQSRMRFIRWDKDSSEQITGGGRSESKAMEDQQTIFKVVRDRLKVFDRMIDGRTEGVRTTYKHKSSIPKQALIQSYGDYIKDYAHNPQRRANIICKQILRDTKQFRDETADADFEIAKYSQLCRRAQTRSTHNSVATADHDGKFTDADSTKQFKTCGILMANIIKGKRQGLSNVKESDADFAEVRESVARKTEPIARDLMLVLRAMNQDSSAGESDITMTVKTAAPTILEHLSRQVVYNHVAPAHHYLNAEVIYRSIKPGADTRKVKDKVITDASSPHIRDTNTSIHKSAKMKIVSGRKLKTTEDAEKFESTSTVSYKKVLAQNGDRRLRITSGEDYAKESDNTQNRKRNHKNYRIVGKNDHETGITFSDNTSKERLTGGLGGKYMTRFIDRDAKSTEQFGNN